MDTLKPAVIDLGPSAILCHKCVTKNRFWFELTKQTDSVIKLDFTTSGIRCVHFVLG